MLTHNYTKYYICQNRKRLSAYLAREERDESLWITSLLIPLFFLFNTSAATLPATHLQLKQHALTAILASFFVGSIRKKLKLPTSYLLVTQALAFTPTFSPHPAATFNCPVSYRFKSAIFRRANANLYSLNARFCMSMAFMFQNI